MTTLWFGLGLAMVSAVAVNWAYSREHDAVASMPPFTWRRPVAFVSALLRSRAWVTAFGMETAGWLLYVAALRLAPLALVQAVCASGIAVLALATARGQPSRLTRREQLAVVVAVWNLVNPDLNRKRVALAITVSRTRAGASRAAAWLRKTNKRISKGVVRAPVVQFDKLNVLWTTDPATGDTHDIYGCVRQSL